MADYYLAETKPIDHDDLVDYGIEECLRVGCGKSFITFAGAGSGKTYSLKKSLEFLKAKYFDDFSRRGKQVAVVTFTNNAANEIVERIEHSSIFTVLTIHSFCWSTIAGFNEDIRRWYLETIPLELEKIRDEEKRGRAGKASDTRKRTINRLIKKIEWLAEPRLFVYDPNGVNSSQNALSHADVLKIFSSFLLVKPMMAEIIINKFPFIFIDESQDTNKDVINAFFKLQESKPNDVVIGLFGDTMQRIFGGGEPSLGVNKPSGWPTFDKKMNHRSARRIVGLGNQIRNEADKRSQFARNGAPEGIVRYFILPQGVPHKDKIESRICEVMMEVTGDAGWVDIKSEGTAILLLEHKMAGRRLGFNELWDRLSKSEKIKDRISDGSNSELNFFSNIVFPIAEASLNKKRAELMRILREVDSPLLDVEIFEAYKDDPLMLARNAEHGFNQLLSSEDVTFGQVLEFIATHRLLRVPEKLQSFVAAFDTSGSTKKEFVLESGVDFPEEDYSEIAAWTEALESKFFQIRNYKSYITGDSKFRTHQGVKGNEFERVMVVMDDDEAGGFLFSYEQYFGAKELSRDSQKKQNLGEETGLDRTRRLFYVTSTRAKSSLAHVIYTSDVVKVRKNLIARKFAREEEIIEFGDG